MAITCGQVVFHLFISCLLPLLQCHCTRGTNECIELLEGFKNGIVKETFYDVICHHKFVTFYRKVNRRHNLPVEM